MRRVRARDEDGEDSWAQAGSLQRDTLGSQGRVHAAPQGSSVKRAHAALGRRKTLEGGESSSCQMRRGLPVKAGHSHSALHLPPLQQPALRKLPPRSTSKPQKPAHDHARFHIYVYKETRCVHLSDLGPAGPSLGPKSMVGSHQSGLGTRCMLKGGMSVFHSRKSTRSEWHGLDARWLELESVLADAASHLSSVDPRACQAPSEKGRPLPYWDEWQELRLPHKDKWRAREASAPPSKARSEPVADRPRRTPARSPRCPPREVECTSDSTCSAGSLGGWEHQYGGIFTQQLKQLHLLCVRKCVNPHATAKALPPSPPVSARISSAQQHADPAPVRP